LVGTPYILKIASLESLLQNNIEYDILSHIMTTSQTVYELGYLLVPTLTDKEVTDTVALLSKTIADNGGDVTTKGDVHFIDLAYEMVKKIKSKNTKFDQAHFGWTKFTAGSETPAKLEKAIKGIDEVLRVIVVKTVEDDAVTDLFVSEEVSETEEADVNKGVAAAGVSTFAELAKTDSDKIQEIITDVRGSHDSGTWPKQAGMAAEGKWDELKAWQDELDGGK